jgi:hypothetical protein
MLVLKNTQAVIKKENQRKPESGGVKITTVTMTNVICIFSSNWKYVLNVGLSSLVVQLDGDSMITLYNLYLDTICPTLSKQCYLMYAFCISQENSDTVTHVLYRAVQITIEQSWKCCQWITTARYQI